MRPASNVRSVFVGKGTEAVSYEGKVDVILSPAYYWFRREALPAKRAATAKKLAPAYFDPILPEGEYDYMAVKADDSAYWLFAYRPADIAEGVTAAGIKPAQVRGVYFAQTECHGMTEPLAVGADEVLVETGGSIGMIRSRYAPAQTDVDTYCSAQPRSPYRVPVSLYRSSILDRTQSKRLTIVALLFALLFGIDYVRLMGERNALEAQDRAIREQYDLPQTSFELNSLLRALEGRAGRQTRMREAVKALGALPLQTGERIETLTLEPKTLSLVFSGVDASRAAVLKNALRRIGTLGTVKQKGERWYAEVRFD